METFKTKVDGVDDDKEYEFLCYDNTEPINIGDYFIFFFAGIADVQQCQSENEKYEINPNNRVRDKNAVLDMVTGFWENCYKIKSTDLDYKKLPY